MTRKGRKKGPPELRSTIKRQGDVIHGGLQGETHVTSSRHDTHCVGPLYYFALETYLTLQGCECIFIILTEVVNLRSSFPLDVRFYSDPPFTIYPVRIFHVHTRIRADLYYNKHIIRKAGNQAPVFVLCQLTCLKNFFFYLLT